MNTHQVAGRHGTFLTQFVRPTRSKFATREAMLRANSRKAVDRRLVLPLDTHEWSRAFEVLNSRYARLGRTAEHYQAVIRDMVAQGKSTQQRAGITEALDRLREQAFAEEIPVSRSLWSSLVYAYCMLEKPEEALETFDQAQRRFTYSTATLQYMAELVLPVVCRAGQYDVACQLYATHFPKSGKHSRKDDETIQRWLAEAAARAGVVPDKVSALLGDTTAMTTETEAETGAARPTRTVHALFLDAETAPRPGTAHQADLQRVRSIWHDDGAGADAREALSRLSTPALRSLLHTACADPEAQLTSALRCWSLLFGPWEAASTPAATSAVTPRLSAPSPADVQLLLNALVVCAHEDTALQLFTHTFLGCAADVFLDVAPTEATLEAPFDLPEGARGTPRYGAMPLDAITLDLVFSAFATDEACVAVPKAAATPSSTTHSPSAAGAVGGVSLNLVRLRNPAGAVRLFDVVLWRRDDAVLTDRMVLAVCSALVQVGQMDRATALLQRSPAFDVHPSKKVDMRVPSDPAQRALRERLCSLVYYLHACTTLDMRVRTLREFPFLFPPEVFRALPPPEELQRLLREEEAQRQASVADAAAQADSDEARFAAALARKDPTSLRPSRHHYFPPRSTAALTASQESAMQHDAVRLLSRKDEAFQGSAADADKDPRPIPKGLHDHASGWDFFGRGGEMVFANHHRTPHLLSMRPKVMRALADPYRSWNPKLNSSLAHKENVLKWNGKSAV